MLEDEFWNLIERSVGAGDGDIVAQAEYLRDRLMELGVLDIVSYDRIHSELMDRAYVAELWDAAAIIGCGCSDDGFIGFRAWLIGHGKEVYESILASPESLADIVELNDRFDTQYGWTLVQFAAFRQIAGEGMGRRLDYTPPALRGQLSRIQDALLRFPRLAEKFGDCSA